MVFLLLIDVWKLRILSSPFTLETHKRTESVREFAEVFSGAILHNLACFYVLHFDLHCAIEGYYPVLNFNFMLNALHWS